jgi:uncharacterized protein
MFSRRQALATSGAGLALLGLARLANAQSLTNQEARGFGPLEPDANNLIALPKGFNYQIISRAGETMSDGLLVPKNCDGMGSFITPAGDIALVRNHEIKGAQGEDGPFGAQYALLKEDHRGLMYDRGVDGLMPQGGTTTLVLDAKTLAVKYQALSLAGTSTNCAGGTTPWGTWLSCEETVETAGDYRAKDHGYVFEVPGTLPAPAVPLPLKALGRFRHEAAIVDPRTGVVYLTEDEQDGLFYRMLPRVKGQLLEGGVLQALCVVGKPGVSTGLSQKIGLSLGKPVNVTWVDLPNTNLPKESKEAKAAARFVRGEGLALGKDGIYFSATQGGSAKRGQIWRYKPARQEGQAGEKAAPGMLSLIAEPNAQAILDMPDNLTYAPFGDLIICEDGLDKEQLLRGLTPQGKLYPLAKRLAADEFCGACFSHDGRYLFVNLQVSGLTLAISGPWQSRIA